MRTLASAVVAAVLALGLLPGPADAAAPAPPGRDPLASVPADFPAVMGYTPVPTRMVDGTLRLAKPTGACSTPGVGAPFGFEQACKVHDYGYDLLRYAHATGRHLTGQERRRIDASFGHDLRARCQAVGGGLAGAGCRVAAWLFEAAVRLNSWRQHWGWPAPETLW